MREWQARNPGYATASQAKRRAADPEAARRRARATYDADPERVLARNARWQRENPDKVREAKRAWEAANRDKKRAHRRVAYAVKTGKLIRQPCESCGATERVHAHHDDYDRPLDVRWLCRKCHGREHRKPR